MVRRSAVALDFMDFSVADAARLLPSVADLRMLSPLLPTKSRRAAR